MYPIKTFLILLLLLLVVFYKIKLTKLTLCIFRINRDCQNQLIWNENKCSVIFLIFLYYNKNEKKKQYL